MGIQSGRPALAEELQSTRTHQKQASCQLSSKSAVSFEYELSSNQSVLMGRLMAADDDVPSHLHIIPGAYEIIGTVEAARLEAALKQMAASHEALRTFFILGEGVVRAAVQPDVQLTLDRLEVDAAQLGALLYNFCSQPFDLTKAPLLRVGLVTTGPRQILVFAAHHLIFDGWSYNLFWEQLANFYATPSDVWPKLYPDGFLPYSAYACWERRRADLPETAKQLEFWRHTLAGLPASISLPVRAGGRPPQFTYRSCSILWRIERQTLHQIRALAGWWHTTSFTVLVSALFWALRQASDQLDLFLRTAIAARNTVEQEGSIGYYASSLVLRVTTTPGATIEGVFHATRKTIIEALSHSDVTRSAINSICGPKQDHSLATRFPIQFIHQRYSRNGPMALGRGCTLDSIPVGNSPDVVHTDLAAYAYESDEDLDIAFFYCIDVYEPQTIQSLCHRFNSALEAICR